MRTRRWDRRTFLKAAGVGAGLGALAPLFPLPLAEASDGPKRLLLVTNGQGTDMTRWRPTGSESSFTLSYCLAPLAPFQSRMLVLDGIDNQAAYGFLGGHFGMSTLWTGVVLPHGTVRPEGCGWPQAPSVERLIAARIGHDTRFDAFYFGTWPATYASGQNQGPNGIAYHRGPDQPIDVEVAPDRAFDRLFAGVTGDVEQIARLRRQRQSVIDVVRGELTRVRAELPAVDRERVDAHLHGVRTLETQLAGLVGMCAVPTRAATYSASDIANYDLHARTTRLMFELIGRAFACDLTRVAAFQWPHSEGIGSFMPAEGYNAFGSFHTVAHDMSYERRDDGTLINEGDRAVARQNMANLTRFRASTIANDLLGRMLPDVLDNTLMVWSSEMSEGGTHSNRNVPTVIVQGSNVRAFRTGRWLRWGHFDPLNNPNADTGGIPMNRLLVSLCHAMGLSDVTRVGDASFAQDPIAELA